MESSLKNLNAFERTFLQSLSKPDENNLILSCKRALITYKSKFCKDDLERFLSTTKKGGFRVCYIAHEDSNCIVPFPHTHVAIDWGKAPNKSCKKFLNFKNNHPDIRKIKNNKEWADACKFICKEDKDVILKDSDIINKKIENLLDIISISDLILEKKILESQKKLIDSLIIKHKAKNKLRIPIFNDDDLSSISDND